MSDESYYGEKPTFPDLHDVINAAREFELSDGSPIDPVGLAIEYGYLGDDYEPLNDNKLNKMLDKWDKQIAKNFKKFKTPEPIQAILRDGAARYFHAFHFQTGMHKHFNGIKMYHVKNTDALQNVRTSDIKKMGKLYQLTSGQATKLLLDDLENAGISDNVKLSGLIGNNVNACMSSYEKITKEPVDIYPPGKNTTPDYLVNSIQTYPERVSKKTDAAFQDR